MRARATILAVLAVAVLTEGCISFNLIRRRSNESVPEEESRPIEPGRTTLGECLARLGAPGIVWPSENGRVVMAYPWLDRLDWGISFSWTFERFASARVEWDAADAEVQGVVLIFDADLTLRSVERGYLRDLVPDPEDPQGGFQDLQDVPR